MLLREQPVFILRATRNTQMHSVGRMQSLNMWEHVVYVFVVTVGL
jgi:hypothetical protein